VDALSSVEHRSENQTSTSVYNINSENINSILQGSSILAGGGGGGYREALDNYRSINPNKVKVKDLQDFSPDEKLATVYGLGPVDHRKNNLIELAQESVELYESEFSEIDGIILGELGPDLIVESIAIADELNIPIVNADVAGMRAVPSIQNEVIEASNLERAPIVATDGDEDIVITNEISGIELERRIRDMASDNMWYITGYCHTAEDFQGEVSEGWFEECHNFPSGRPDMEIIGSGRIENTEVRDIEGHTVGRITIEGNSTYQVFFRNENILLLEDGEPIVEAPETITLISESGYGIYNGEIPSEGEGVTIARIEYEEIWDEEMRDIFNLEAGFELEGASVVFGNEEAFEKEGEIAEFSKIHSLGNDFIVLDGRNNNLGPNRGQKLAPELCKRRFGIGANDLLYLQESKNADARMRVFEPNGEEADMCGNGIRCVAHFLQQKEFPIKIETNAGVIQVESIAEGYKVDMGRPNFSRNSFTSENSYEEMIEEEITVGEESYSISGVNTGEPHLVIFTENLDEIDVDKIGRKIRNSDIAPEEGVNVNFVEIISENTIRIRTYERGVEEETMACGTGSTASAVISQKIKDLNNQISVETKGGTLEVISENKTTYLIGKAESIFNGRINIGDKK
jgi:diaminopimelate epimerase